MITRYDMMLVFMLSLMLVHPCMGIEEIHAVYIEEPIKIDGQFSENAWRKAVPASSFRLVNGNMLGRSNLGKKNGSMAELQTLVRALYSKDALYLGFECEEPTKDFLNRAKKVQKGTVVHNRIELAIKIPTVPEEHFDRDSAYFYFVLSANGDLLTLCYNSYDIVPNKWTPAFQIARADGDGRWRIEIELPYSIFQVPKPLKNEIWKINFTRERAALDEKGTQSNWEESAWSGSGFHSKTGVLIFE